MVGFDFIMSSVVMVLLSPWQQALYDWIAGPASLLCGGHIGARLSLHDGLDGKGWGLDGKGWGLDGKGWGLDGQGWGLDGQGWSGMGTGWSGMGTGWSGMGTGW